MREIYAYFVISDHEKYIGGYKSDQIMQVIITSVKDVIYLEQKQGKEIKVEDVKRCLEVLKNLNIIKTREITTNNINSFEENWKPFITELRSDIHTK